MNIICNNINDFCTMITTCSCNNIKDIRIFISETESYPNGVITPSSLKNNTYFTYVLLTPLYTAIYSDNVKNTEYDNIYKILEECQENCNHDFRIQIFDKLNFKDNNLYIGKELQVI